MGKTQEVVFLNHDFTKVYDNVAWKFVFHAMLTIEINPSFIEMTKILFQEASVVVNINGQPFKQFETQKGVRQGCPLAPCYSYF